MRAPRQQPKVFPPKTDDCFATSLPGHLIVTDGRAAQERSLRPALPVGLQIAQQRSLIHLARREKPDGVNGLPIAREVSDIPDRVQRR